MDIKHLNFMIHNYGIEYFKKYYDLLFFDATYEDSKENIQAISLAEKLNELDSSYFTDVARIFIGKDIIDYVEFENFELRQLIKRAKNLPYVIYGNEYGTKSDRMIAQIKTIGRRKGIKIIDKMQYGNCRLELLKKLEPYMKDITESIEEQKRLCNRMLIDFDKWNIANEEERIIIDSIKNIETVICRNIHEMGQYYSNIIIRYNEGKEKKSSGGYRIRKRYLSYQV